MIKVIVKSIFRDKENPKEIVPLNKELNVSKERYEEIKEYVDIIKNTANKEEKKQSEVEN